VRRQPAEAKDQDDENDNTERTGVTHSRALLIYRRRFVRGEVPDYEDVENSDGGHGQGVANHEETQVNRPDGCGFYTCVERK